MSDKALNWGLLSTARINRALIPVIKSSARNRLAAVASRTQESAEAYAKEWRIGRAHGSYEALLDDPEVDVVYNPLPNSMHAEWTIRALRAGKHVLCEKPLAISVEEVDAIAAAARETGKIAAEALMYRHHPQTRKVKELVESGSLGTVQVIKGAFTFNLQRKGDVRLIPELGGGGIWDVGSYPISYARMISGSEPEEVFGWQVLSNSGVDVIFTGQMRFPNRILAQFDCGFRSPERKYIEIIGSEASLYVPQPFSPRTDERLEIRRGEKTETILIPGEELYKGEVEDMAEAALNGETPRVSLQDSRGTVAAVTALIESARTGQPVRL
jgi:predicted dehydrogenase